MSDTEVNRLSGKILDINVEYIVSTYFGYGDYGFENDNPIRIKAYNSYK